MMRSGKLVSSYSGLIPFETVLEKRGGSPWPISRKKNLISLRSVAFVTIFYAIWSTSTNFTVVWKLLDNFFQKLDNSEVNRQFILPPSFKDTENKEGN